MKLTGRCYCGDIQYTLDDPSVFKATAAIFTIDKQPFHHIPDGIPAFERRPA